MSRKAKKWTVYCTVAVVLGVVEAALHIPSYGIFAIAVPVYGGLLAMADWLDT